MNIIEQIKMIVFTNRGRVIRGHLGSIRELKTMPFEMAVNVNEISEENFLDEAKQFELIVRYRAKSSFMTLYQCTCPERAKTGDVRPNIFYSSTTRVKSFLGGTYKAIDKTNFYMKRNNKFYHVSAESNGGKGSIGLNYEKHSRSYFNSFVVISYMYRHMDLTDIYDMFYFATEL